MSRRLKLWHQRATDLVTMSLKIHSWKKYRNINWLSHDKKETDRTDRRKSFTARASFNHVHATKHNVPELLLLPNRPQSLQLLITSYNSPVISMEIVLRFGTLISFDSMIVAAVANIFVVMFVPSKLQSIFCWWEVSFFSSSIMLTQFPHATPDT